MQGWAVQHMSLGLGVQVPGSPPPRGVPVQAAATHAPVVVLQTGVVPLHCESRVHLPHVLGPPAPQMVPFVLAAQSAFVQQLPGTHVSVTALPAQQKSAGFEHAVSGVVQVLALQVPVVAPGVAQKSPGP
jgi:hypothetical protein